MEDFPVFKQTEGTNAPDEGYREDKSSPRAAFVRYDSPDSPQPAVTLRSGSPLPAGMVLTDQPLTPIESTYLPAIKRLCEHNDAALAIMTLPIADNQGPMKVSRQILALGIPILASSLKSMFGDIPTDRIKENYADHIHFNSNGARRAAQVFGPSLQALLPQTRG